MTFIKESFLIEKAKDFSLERLAESRIIESHTQITIFLSHSHKDKEIAIQYVKVKI